MLIGVLSRFELHNQKFDIVLELAYLSLVAILHLREGQLPPLFYVLSSDQLLYIRLLIPLFYFLALADILLVFKVLLLEMVDLLVGCVQ